jgi:hypothetical protein
MLFPSDGAARTWHGPADAPTIQAGIESASTGDDVLVAPGTYFEHNIIMKAGVWVHSEDGPSATTVDANANGVGFDCAGLWRNTVLEGFTILNGLAEGPVGDDNSGGGIRSVASNLVVHDCVIAECVANYYGGGIYAWDSDIQIVGCRITDCSAYLGGGGIGIINSDETTARVANTEVLDNTGAYTGGIGARGAEVTIDRCVISGNEGTWGGVGGLACESPVLAIRDCVIIDNLADGAAGGTSGLNVNEGSSGLISGCTIANNTGVFAGDPAVSIGGYYEATDIDINRTIIAFNDGIALECEYDSYVAIHCCDSFGNTDGDDLCGTDVSGNFSLDPLFCDPNSDDYALDACSPCLPGNHPEGIPCGLIGALGQGCGATPVAESSWGKIKDLYRRR